MQKEDNSVCSVICMQLNSDPVSSNPSNPSNHRIIEVVFEVM